MKHRKAVLKLNRTPSHRKAMFRNMVTSLFKHERIKTTGAKAKELSRWADHLITLAKRGDLHARRQALAIVREKDVVHKLFEQAAQRYGSASGGYTRVIKLGRRPGDAAPVSLVELIYTQEAKKKRTKKKKVKADAAPAKTAVDSKKGAGSKAAGTDDKKADKAAEKETKAKSATKTTSKKKATADEKVEKAEAKAPAKKKTAAKKETGQAAEEKKPKKKAKAAAPKEDGADAKKKKAAAKTTKKDEK